MTSETEALCAKVSAHRNEWALTDQCKCGHDIDWHDHVTEGHQKQPADFSCDQCNCKAFAAANVPLDWTLPENAWKLLDSIRRQGYYEVRMTADMLSLVPTDDAPAEIVQGVFMDLDAEISLEEAAVWLYAKAHGLTPSTEGR